MFAFWPENRVWSFQLTRVLGESMYGGGEAHEVLTAAKEMTLGDGESWYAGFHALAMQAESAGRVALAKGLRATGRSHLLRAAGYQRWSEFFLKHDDDRRRAAFAGAIESFRLAGPLLDAPLEQVSIPFEGHRLPGYFFRAPGQKEPGPVIIYVAGADVYKEELYFLGGAAALERGLSVLVFDGPGQGETLRFAGVPTRPDWEVVLSAAVDYLTTRPDVDPERIGLVGRSFGGYYAGRGLANEHRFKAGVIFGALYDARTVYEQYPPLREQLLFLLGGGDPERLDKFTLAGQLSKVQAPVLILHGEDDFVVGPDHAWRTYADLPEPKELFMYPAGQLGALHCQHEAFPDAMPRIFDWLTDRLS